MTVLDRARAIVSRHLVASAEDNAATPATVLHASQRASSRVAAVAAPARSAIMEIDGGLPREWANALAEILDGPRPQGCSKPDWDAACDDVLRFADRYGAMLAGLGWSFNDVFGLHAFWLRLDQRGVAWFVRGGRVVEADADLITFERDGARYTHSRT